MVGVMVAMPARDAKRSVMNLSPGCRNCLKLGKPYPGYPDRSKIQFRSENEVVQRKVHVTNAVARNAYFTVDVHHHALCFFFRDYVLPPSDGFCPGWLNFLPDLYHRAVENSVLRQAVLAAAYTDISQKMGNTQLSIQATSYYLKSLELVNSALSDRVAAVSDCTMISVILLGLYECMNSTYAGDLQLHHSRGLGVLANTRGPLNDGYGPDLLQIVCCQTQRRNLDHALTPGSEDEQLVNLLDRTSMASRMIRMMYDVDRFVAEVKTKSDSLHLTDFSTVACDAIAGCSISQLLISQ